MNDTKALFSRNGNYHAIHRSGWWTEQEWDIAAAVTASAKEEIIKTFAHNEQSGWQIGWFESQCLKITGACTAFKWFCFYIGMLQSTYICMFLCGSNLVSIIIMQLVTLTTSDKVVVTIPRCCPPSHLNTFNLPGKLHQSCESRSLSSSSSSP